MSEVAAAKSSRHCLQGTSNRGHLLAVHSHAPSRSCLHPTSACRTMIAARHHPIRPRIRDPYPSQRCRRVSLIPDSLEEPRVSSLRYWPVTVVRSQAALTMARHRQVVRLRVRGRHGCERRGRANHGHGRARRDCARRWGEILKELWLADVRRQNLGYAGFRRQSAALPLDCRRRTTTCWRVLDP